MIWHSIFILIIYGTINNENYKSWNLKINNLKTPLLNSNSTSMEAGNQINFGYLTITPTPKGHFVYLMFRKWMSKMKSRLMRKIKCISILYLEKMSSKLHVEACIRLFWQPKGKFLLLAVMMREPSAEKAHSSCQQKLILRTLLI